MFETMSKEEFDYLHELIRSDIQKQNTQFRRAVSSEERLAVTQGSIRYNTVLYKTEIKYLTGNSFRNIGFNYRLGFSTVRTIVYEVCDAIWNKLGPIVMPELTEETWKTVAQKYKDMWHFPNCIGAIDGKHINIECPINSGSTFFNYKGSHSV
ncbi:protein ALP1-like, partial [Aphis craccivora]